MKHLIIRFFSLILTFTAVTYCTQARASENDGTANETAITSPTDFNRYAVFCIRNDLQVAKKYQRSWGNSEWITYTLQPGEMKYHSWKLESNSTSFPTPHVRFDSDMQSGEIFSIKYRMEPYLSPDQLCANAKRYHFVYDGSTRRYADIRGMN